VNDRIIVVSYCDMEEVDARNHKPRVVFLDDDNTPKCTPARLAVE
jgi:aspartate 1-decarboxylase